MNRPKNVRRNTPVAKGVFNVDLNRHERRKQKLLGVSGNNPIRGKCVRVTGSDRREARRV